MMWYQSLYKRRRQLLTLLSISPCQPQLLITLCYRLAGVRTATSPRKHFASTPNGCLIDLLTSNMTHKKGTILMTGANGGLGAAIVSKISNDAVLSKDYLGIYTVRSLARADAVTKVLNSNTTTRNHEHELVALDLTSLAATRKVAEDINERVATGQLPPIRALIINAASQEYTTSTITADGFDRTWQGNYLSHFLLTLMLLQSMDKSNGRIFVTGSWSHKSVLPENPHTLPYDTLSIDGQMQHPGQEERNWTSRKSVQRGEVPTTLRFAASNGR
jgi:hypothetical protein